MNRNDNTILSKLLLKGMGYMIIALSLTLHACEDMLGTKSNVSVTNGEYQITNGNEAAKAIMGILAEVQQVADRYVLLGELRGDLMTTSEYASSDLKEINDFQVSVDNEYAGKYAYYNIINNCNVVLQKLDTTLTVHTRKVLLPAYVMTKTIRAWTWLQLALNYGTVKYCTEPIVDYQASLAEYPVIELDNLADLLIEELNPYREYYDRVIMVNFLPHQLLLGDLYLYKNNYQEAAAIYYNVMNNERNSYTIGDYVNQWDDINRSNLLKNTHPASYAAESIAELLFDDDPRTLHSSRLVHLSYNDKPSLLPANHYIRFMSEAPYLYLASNKTTITPVPSGDLRGNMQGAMSQWADAYEYMDIKGERNCLIYKYMTISYALPGGYDPNNGLIEGRLVHLRALPVYRIPHLYLRYAEAVNRAGKPTLAFAVLKHGLTYANVNDSRTAKVDPEELGENYTYFPQGTAFDFNIATAVRGRGDGIPQDTLFFRIPSLPAKQDSILWVEDRILEELSAETPFEGNRFFDLLRVSRRRPGHPAFMAEKVAEKYENPEAMAARLKNDVKAWFLP